MNKEKELPEKVIELQRRIQDELLVGLHWKDSPELRAAVAAMQTRIEEEYRLAAEKAFDSTPARSVTITAVFEDLDPPVVIDYSTIDNSLRSGEMCIPSGLTPEERRRYVSNELSKIPSGVKQL